MTDAEFSAKLDSIVAQLTKDLGKGSIMRSDTIPDHVDVIPTGIIGIDNALGVGGIPRGRITEIYGPESSGKSTLTLHVVAQCQQAGGVAAYIDAEHAFDPDYAEAIGVNISTLLVSQPDHGEAALEIVEALVRTGEVQLIVIDSVASLVPRAELEGDMGQSFVGLQARLMSQAMRKLAGVTSKSNTALVFINQLREKVGVMYGNPEVTPGGRALKFYSSVRIELRRGTAIDSNGTQEGFNCKVKTVKNKVAPPFKQVEVPLLYGIGFDAMASMVQMAISLGFVIKTASWYSYQDQKFQGMPALLAYLSENQEAMEELKERIVHT